MTASDHGVYEPPGDPWAEMGNEPHENGPSAPQGDMPACPWCENREGHELNRSPLGGLLCGQCGNQFTSAPGEYEAMAGRRAIWAEIMGRRDR